MKKYQSFYLKISIYLNRRVFVMAYFIPEFLKWNLHSLILDLSIDAHRAFSLKSKTKWPTA